MDRTWSAVHTAEREIALGDGFHLRFDNRARRTWLGNAWLNVYLPSVIEDHVKHMERRRVESHLTTISFGRSVKESDIRPLAELIHGINSFYNLCIGDMFRLRIASMQEQAKHTPVERMRSRDGIIPKSDSLFNQRGNPQIGSHMSKHPPAPHLTNSKKPIPVQRNISAKNEEDQIGSGLVAHWIAGLMIGFSIQTSHSFS